MRRAKISAAVVIWGVLMSACSLAFAGTIAVHPQKPLVVVDAGHGGTDMGARGTGELTEKGITLQVARLLAEALSDTCRTQLTRSDDYILDAVSRAGMANEAQAALFVSLHVGGSFGHQADDLTVYHYEVAKQKIFGMPPKIAKPFDAPLAPETWRDIHSRHGNGSRMLARLIHHQLEQVHEPVRVAGADLVVLAGANMPAVLIELASLETPMSEKRLANREYLSALAKAIGAGIVGFLRGGEEISSTDLHR